MEVISHTHQHTSESNNMNLLTMICLMTAFFFHLMAAPGAFYDLAFKFLSLIPVAMAVVINYPKFEQRLKAWRSKRKNKPRRR